MRSHTRLLFALLLAALLPAILAGCAHRNSIVIVQREEKITDPKIIGLRSIDAPWVENIVKGLQRNGFQVIRVAGNAAEQSGEPEWRHLLVVDGTVLREKADQCAEGNYYFRDLQAHMFDRKTSRLELAYDGAGCSGGVVPIPGAIYADFINAVVEMWEWRKPARP
jgi:hypothetical protein